MTTDATNGIEPIIVGIKRDTREILDIFASGGASSSRPGEYAASPGQQTDIVITVKLDGTGRDFVETNRRGSGGGEQIRIAPNAPVTAPVVASQAPVVSSPAPVASVQRARDATGRFVRATSEVTTAVEASDAAAEQRNQQLISTITTSGTGSVTRNRDRTGRFASAGQRAHERSTSGGAATASGTDARPQSFMGRLKNAGVAATRNGDLAETAGLATLGPITGVISEMVGLGSQIKETFTGIVDKFRGRRGNRGTGDRSVDAQIRATSEVTTAVHASDTAAEQRNQQLIGAISTLGDVQTVSGPSRSAGQQAHDEATHGGTTTITAGATGAGGGTGRPGGPPSGGGLLSRIGSNITNGIADAITGSVIATAITGFLTSPAGIAAVVAAGAVVAIGIRGYGAYHDEEGQRKAFKVKPGEEVSNFQKSLYTSGAVAENISGLDAQVERLKTESNFKAKENYSFLTMLKDMVGVKDKKEATPERHAINSDGSSQPKDATTPERHSINPDGSSQQGPPKKAEMTGVLATAFKAQQEIIRTALEMATAAAKSARLPVHGIRSTKVGRVIESGSSLRTTPAQTTTTTSPVATSSPGTPAPAQTASPVATSGKKKKSGGKKDDYEYAGLGSLAEHYESRGDVGAVAPDVKGMAYGKFQMHSGGTVGDFIKQSPWAKDFEGMKPGSKEYNEQWPKTAAKNPEAFGQAQFDFIKKTHYGPTERKAKKMGIDTTDPMLQEVLFSTGTQHGSKGGPQILDQAFNGVDPKTLSKEQIRERIYAERGRKNADGTLAHFSSLKGGIEAHNKQGNRFINENKDAAKIGALSSSAVASTIGQPIDDAMVPAAPTGPASETPAPVQAVPAVPVSAPTPETAPVQTVATDVQHGKKEPSIFAQAMKGVDPKTLTSAQRRDMYFAEKNRKDANGNLVHPLKATGKDAQISQPIDEATSQTAAPVQTVTTSPVSAPAPAPEPTAPVQTATGTKQAKEPSIFAQAMKGTDPRTLTSEQRRDMYFAEKNRKDANGNLVHPLKAKGKDAQISQPIDEATSQPAAIASSQQTQPPAPAPIVQPKPEPQPVVIANSGGSSGGSSGTGGGQQGGFQKAQTDRRQNQPQQQSQTQKQPSIIPFEFDDIMLTLMTHDLM